MVDPDIAYQDYPSSLQRGIDDNVFLLRENGSVWKGVVWPGVVAFPDWFATNISKYWVRKPQIIEESSAMKLLCPPLGHEATYSCCLRLANC